MSRAETQFLSRSVIGGWCLHAVRCATRSPRNGRLLAVVLIAVLASASGSGCQVDGDGSGGSYGEGYSIGGDPRQEDLDPPRAANSKQDGTGDAPTDTSKPNSQQSTNRPSASTSPSDVNLQLDDAVWRGPLETVRDLIAKGANVDAVDSSGDPLLFEAVWRGHVEITRLLVEAGANVDAVDSSGDPLLFEAVWRGHVEITRLLVEAGANVDAVDSSGDSILREATWRRHDEIVRILMAAGADMYPGSDR